MKALPDRRGYFGEFGGQYVPETLMAALDEFETAYRKLRRDRSFRRELDSILEDYVGRPTPVTEAVKFGALCGDFKLFLKREDLNHTGAHKINNAIGQALIAKRMRKQRIIAETGAGQHGVATATACALLGLECVVYMGEVDMARQELGEHAARFSGGALGVLHGTRSMVLQDEFGQIAETHSISAGLDYPSIGPEHAHLQKLGRVEYYDCSDELALEAFHRLSETEGIIPALESAHALGWLLRNGKSIKRNAIVVANLSGRRCQHTPNVA